MDRLIGDDLFQNVCRRRPVDRLQYQKTGIEPHPQKRTQPGINPCGITLRRITVLVDNDLQPFTQPYQPYRTVLGAIQAAEQLLPAWLGKGGNLRQTARIGFRTVMPCCIGKRGSIYVICSGDMPDERR